MNRWEPRAIIVLVIALGVTIAHVFAITVAAFQGRQLTDIGGDVLIAILGAMVAIVAGYVGHGRNGGNDAEQKSNRSKSLEHDSEKPESGAE